MAFSASSPTALLTIGNVLMGRLSMKVPAAAPAECHRRHPEPRRPVRRSRAKISRLHQMRSGCRLDGRKSQTRAIDVRANLALMTWLKCSSPDVCVSTWTTAGADKPECWKAWLEPKRCA
ncbi:Exocyst complex protein EXO70, partial [Clarias magur]